MKNGKQQWVKPVASIVLFAAIVFVVLAVRAYWSLLAVPREHYLEDRSVPPFGYRRILWQSQWKPVPHQAGRPPEEIRYVAIEQRFLWRVLRGKKAITRRTTGPERGMETWSPARPFEPGDGPNM